MTRFDVTLASHPGKVRTANQDQVVVSNLVGNGNFAKPATLDLDTAELVAVLDGMGGHTGGETASRIAAAILASCWEPPETEQDLAQLIQTANHAVFDEMERRPDLSGMGTTVVAAVPAADGWIIGHVGDARAYAEADGFAVCLTDDDRNRDGLLTQSLGGTTERTDVAVHVSRHLYRTHQRLLLCTDGLWEHVSFAGIQDALVGDDPLASVQSLIDQSLDAGAPDNVTAVLIDRKEGQRQ